MSWGPGDTVPFSPLFLVLRVCRLNSLCQEPPVPRGLQAPRPRGWALPPVASPEPWKGLSGTQAAHSSRQGTPRGVLAEPALGHGLNPERLSAQAHSHPCPCVAHGKPRPQGRGVTAWGRHAQQPGALSTARPRGSAEVLCTEAGGALCTWPGSGRGADRFKPRGGSEVWGRAPRCASGGTGWELAAGSRCGRGSGAPTLEGAELARGPRLTTWRPA